MKEFIKKYTTKIIIIALLLSVCISSVIYATTIIGGVEVNTEKEVDTSDIETASEKIIGIIQTVGVLLAVGIIMVLGIKYMMGSAEEKAEYKKVFIPYLIGAIILFAASSLAGAIFNMINSAANGA